MKKYKTKLAILGSGPAGYTAAIYSARANLNPILISGNEKGGQLMKTTNIDNWPGGKKNLQGPELMNQMEKHIKRLKIKIINEQINDINIKNYPFILKSENNIIIECKSIIIATGATPNKLGIENEEYYTGKGISTCATCDGFFYKNKTVAIVGGGDKAIEEALYLSNIAENVILIHRRDKFRATKILIEQVISKNKKIRIIYDSIIKEIIGDLKKIKKIKIENIKNKNEIIEEIDGLFISIGQNPNTSILKNKINLDENGYIIIENEEKSKTKTNICGVFAAGDVQDKFYRQAITSAASGCMSAIDAEKYIEEKKI